MLDLCLSLLFFFVKQKTAYEMRISDWSSDVCSSDLVCAPFCPPGLLLSWQITQEVVAMETQDTKANRSTIDIIFTMIHVDLFEPYNERKVATNVLHTLPSNRAF